MTSIRHSRPRAVALAVLVAAAVTLLQGATARGSQTLVVTSVLDDGTGSLRQAVRDAAAGDTITFADSLRGQMIVITTGEIAMTRDLTVAGPGANQLTIHAAGSSRIFSIAAGATVSISGVTLTGAQASDGKGGAIRNEGTLSLADAAIVSLSLIHI